MKQADAGKIVLAANRSGIAVTTRADDYSRNAEWWVQLGSDGCWISEYDAACVALVTKISTRGKR